MCLQNWNCPPPVLLDQLIRNNFPCHPHPTHWLSKCSTLLTVVTQINTYSQKHIVLLSFWREPERERHMLWGKKLQFLTWSFGVWAEEFRGFNRVSSTDVWYEKYLSHKWITKENPWLGVFSFAIYIILDNILHCLIPNLQAFMIMFLGFWINTGK